MDDAEFARWCTGAVLLGLIFGGTCWAIGRNRGRGGLGFILGFFLWILGVILIVCITRNDDDGPRPGLP